MKKTTVKILIASSATILISSAASILSYMTSKFWINTALDREAPKSAFKKFSRKSNNNYSLNLLRQKQSEVLKKLPLKTYKITSRDGKTLVAHFYDCPYPKRIIIAMHGWRSSWASDFSMFADFWHSNDCSVLYVEQRGQGESEGEYMGFGMLERFDCLDWINWVDSHNSNNLPIYLAGISMGATTVLMTSGFKLPENVRGIIADCGFTSIEDIWRYTAKKNHINYDIRHRSLNYLCKKKINLTPKEYSTLNALKTNKIPVLFIHGTDDEVVPIDMTYQNYNACFAPKFLLVVPSASHGISYLIEKNIYEEAVKNFWENYD